MSTAKMSPEQLQLTILHGVLVQEGPEKQAKVMAVAERIRSIVKEEDAAEEGIGTYALALVGAEMAASD